MGRIYIPSTPASRGEVDPGEEVTEAGLPADLTEEEALALLEEAAASIGYRLVPIGEDPDSETEPDGGEPDGGKSAEEPPGNASGEVWAEYARTVKGAQEADLVDDQGQPLGRDALREKFGTPAS